jgi:ketosteroid isomerase-like protein
MAEVASRNVENVIAAYERFNSGDRVPSLDYWHEDGTYAASSEDPDSAVHRGWAAIRQQFANWAEAYPDLKVEPLEIRENGDMIFAWVRFSGHGESSGLPIDMELAHVSEMRDGKVVHLVEYMDRAEGLAAAGLTE